MELELEIAATSTTTQCVWTCAPMDMCSTLPFSVCVQKD